MLVTLDELLALPDAEDDIKTAEIAGLGLVRARPLSLDEHRQIRDECAKGDAWDTGRFEALTLSTCMVEPRMDYDQAAKLRRKGAGLVQSLITWILDLSGLTLNGMIKAKAVDKAEAAFPERSGEVQNA
jgi:hypothetical protein